MARSTPTSRRVRTAAFAANVAAVGALVASAGVRTKDAPVTAATGVLGVLLLANLHHRIGKENSRMGLFNNHRVVNALDEIESAVRRKDGKRAAKAVEKLRETDPEAADQIVNNLNEQGLQRLRNR